MIENNGPKGDGSSGEQEALPIDNNFKAGLALRWQAYRYAQDAGADQWDFRHSNGLNFAPRTCFVLTPKGAAFAGRVLAAGNRHQIDT